MGLSPSSRTAGGAASGSTDRSKHAQKGADVYTHTQRHNLYIYIYIHKYIHIHTQIQLVCRLNTFMDVVMNYNCIESITAI